MLQCISFSIASTLCELLSGICIRVGQFERRKRRSVDGVNMAIERSECQGLVKCVHGCHNAL